MGEVAGAQRRGVVLVRAPGAQQQGGDRLDDVRVVAERHPGPLGGQVLRGQLRLPGEPPVAVGVRRGQVGAGPVPGGAEVHHAGEAGVRVGVHPAGHHAGHGASLSPLAGVEVQDFLPLRHQVAEMDGVAGVLLRHLEFDHRIGARQRAEEGMGGLADLEVDRPVLDLYDRVVRELPVQRCEVLVGLPVPSLVAVVDERPPHHDAAVRFEGARQHVGPVGVGTSVVQRSGAPLGVGLHQEAAEVLDPAVDLLGPLLPPSAHTRVERVGRVQPAQVDGGGEVRRDVQRHAVAAQYTGQRGQLGQERLCEVVRSRVDVVDHGAVDPERGQDTRVVRVPAVESRQPLPVEEGPARIAALDRTVRVVPVVGHAQPGGGALREIDVLQRLSGLHEPQQVERTVEHTAVGVGRHHGADPAALSEVADDVSLVAQPGQVGLRDEFPDQGGTRLGAHHKRRAGRGVGAWPHTRTAGIVDHRQVREVSGAGTARSVHTKPDAFVGRGLRLLHARGR